MTASAAFEAIGVKAEVVVTDADVLTRAAALLREELRALDQACSRFREDSDLQRLNRAGGTRQVSPLLREAIIVALEAAAATGGAVDPTVGRSLAGLGLDRDFALVRTTRHIRVTPAPGWRSVNVDQDAGTVTIPRGVELDLGATAKAFAADRAAERIAGAMGCGVLVNLGGDLAACGSAPSGGWPILVTDNHRAGPETPGQTVSFSLGGLATSSTTVRRWLAGGRERHHIIDPRTGLSASEHWRTVSVAAVDCTRANTASTAAIVLGPRAPRWLEQRSLPARLVRYDGAIITTCDWPS